MVEQRRQIGFSIRDHDYVAYAPTGASWTVSGASITSTLAGKGYFSVAVLPTTAADADSTRTALATTYGRYAHAHVTGTRVSYSYAAEHQQGEHHLRLHHRGQGGHRDQDRGRALPAPVEGPDRRARRSSQTYVSPRGQMKILVGVSSFATSMKYHGVLPELPAVATSAGADLRPCSTT